MAIFAAGRYAWTFPSALSAVYRTLLHESSPSPTMAFAWFDLVREWPLPSLVTLDNEPRFTALRADRRFKSVRRRLNPPLG